MKTRTLSIMSLAVVAAAVTMVHAAPRKDEDLKNRIRGAERAVVARVMRVDPYVKKNQFGDVLIMSHVQMAVEETLKGTQASTVPMEVEGGTMNGLTLNVSDMPSLKPGDRAVVMLTRGRSGENLPYQRGAGVLELDAQDHVKNSDLWLDDVRVAAAGAR